MNKNCTRLIFDQKCYKFTWFFHQKIFEKAFKFLKKKFLIFFNTKIFILTADNNKKNYLNIHICICSANLQQREQDYKLMQPHPVLKSRTSLVINYKQRRRRSVDNSKCFAGGQQMRYMRAGYVLQRWVCKYICMYVCM